MIVPCTSTGAHGWLSLRQALWPDGPVAGHPAKMQSFLDQPGKYV
jgi:aminoglycoside 6'-N-acetyltransferase I